MIDSPITGLILVGFLFLIWRGPRSPSLTKVEVLLALAYGLKALADPLDQRGLWLSWVVLAAAIGSVVGALYYVPSAWRESRARER